MAGTSSITAAHVVATFDDAVVGPRVHGLSTYFDSTPSVIDDVRSFDVGHAALKQATGSWTEWTIPSLPETSGARAAYVGSLNRLVELGDMLPLTPAEVQKFVASPGYSARSGGLVRVVIERDGVGYMQQVSTAKLPEGVRDVLRAAQQFEHAAFTEHGAHTRPANFSQRPGGPLDQVSDAEAVLDVGKELSPSSVSDYVGDSFGALAT